MPAGFNHHVARRSDQAEDTGRDCARLRSAPLTIGAANFGYAEIRNFVDLPYRHTRFRRVRDLYWLPRALAYRTLGRVPPRLLNTFNDLDLNRVDGYHFFNCITPSRRPWLVTFESSVPRHEPGFEEGYRWLAGDSCKAIIAISERARHLQMFEMDAWPRYCDAISEKMQVIHPPQRLIAATPRGRPDDEIVVTFVGNFFFHKGGHSLLKAFARMKKSSSRLKLNVVSGMQMSGARDCFVTDAIRAEVSDLLSSTPGLTYRQQLPNPEVLNLLQRSDVAILPSFGETYGYAALEAMACGCAVIVPRLPPFTEIMNDECAYFLDIPVIRDKGLDVVDFTHGYEHVDDALTTEIVRVFDGLENQADALTHKAHAAIDRVVQNHCPQKAADRIEKIYDDAVAT